MFDGTTLLVSFWIILHSCFLLHILSGCKACSITTDDSFFSLYTTHLDLDFASFWNSVCDALHVYADRHSFSGTKFVSLCVSVYDRSHNK